MKKRNPLRKLIPIPVILAVDMVVLYAAMMLDNALITPDPTAVGSPVPVITLMAFCVMGMVTVFITVASVIGMIAAIIRNRREETE